MVYRILVVILLLTLIGVILFQNKREIDASLALAELKVEEWPVVVEEIKLSTYQESYQLTGILSPREELNIHVLVSGKIVELHKREGDEVKAGDLIARIDSKTLTNEIEVSDLTLIQARMDLNRMRALKDGEAVTSQQLEQAELRVKSEEVRNKALKSRMRDSDLTAAMAGTIATLNFKEGEVVSPGRPLGVIVDLSKVILTVFVSSSQILRLKLKQSIDIEVEEYPNMAFTGTISKLASKENEGLKYAVEIDVNRIENYPLLSGMFATARFNHEKQNSIIIRRSSVLGGLNDSYVFLNQDGLAKKRSVKVGKTVKNGIEIVDGLNEGEQLIVSGQRNLKEGVKVRIVTD